MIAANNYYDSRLSPDGAGIGNDFKVLVVKEDTVIYDAATKLTWLGGSDFPRMQWIKAKAYVDTLAYAGGGWRLPTLKEAMSLIEPEKVDQPKGDGLHIDARFNDTPYFWTVEKHTNLRVWYVVFKNVGRCSFIDSRRSIAISHVRAVR